MSAASRPDSSALESNSACPVTRGKKVYLVDGSGYIFRAFHAVAPLTNKQGLPTNALFGFTRMLLRLLKEPDASHVVMVFDAGRETFRNALYSEYKANRAAPPEELVPQFPYFREIATAIGLPVLELKGYEADDIIGTLARRLAGHGIDVVLVSGDKDLMQLVGNHISMWDTMRDRRIGVPEVIEKFGVPPEHVVDVLALIGDDSDNVPGLSGVGPKTAAQLVEKFGPVEQVLASVEAIRNDVSIRNRNKIADRIEEDQELVRLSRKLVEIDCATPVQMTCRMGGHGSEQRAERGAVSLSESSDEELVGACARELPDREKLTTLFQMLDFSSLLKEFDLSSNARASGEEEPRYLLVDRARFPEFLRELSSQTEFAFDVETTALDPFAASVVGVSFCWCDHSRPWSEHYAYYVPIGHTEGKEHQITFAEFVAGVGEIFADPQRRKIGQNLKFDINALATQTPPVTTAGVYFDTMVASYILNPDRSSHGLTPLAQEVLGRQVIEYDEVVGERANFSEVALEPATRYGCQDAHFAWLIYKSLSERLHAQELEGVFHDIEMPLVPVLARMERAGILLDTKLLGAMSQDLAGRLSSLQRELYEMCGGEFNLNSPKQLAEVLFNKLGLSTKGIKRTKTGISTDADVLERLSGLHPVPKLILEYRALHKLKSTYVDALPAQVSRYTGRLHTRFNQTVTGTGRLSSSDPNLQNIPIQNPEGRRIRAAFIAPEGKRIISADYSQIELRVLAHLSSDENLVSAFADGVDIHSKTTREILGIAPQDPITAEQRRIGKTINFGIIYGMGAFRLAKELSISHDVAQRYIDGYFARYPKVREYFDSLEKDVLERGFVTTMFGRKRFIAGIDASGRDRGFVIRAALNAPLQGSAADLVKRAMIALDRRIQSQVLRMRMLVQIHDELLFEAEEEAVDELVPLIRSEMEGAANLRVPLQVEIGSGRSWEESHA